MILDIGPSYDEYIESAYDGWIKVLARRYSGKDLEDLCEAEDRVYTEMMNFERVDLYRISGSESYEVVVYKGARYDNTSFRRARKYFDQRKPEAPRTSVSPVRSLRTNGCTGLVPATARPGNVVVRFKGCLAAMVVRPAGVKEYSTLSKGI